MVSFEQLALKNSVINKEESRIWFKVGVKFADGSIEKMYSDGTSATTIARELFSNEEDFNVNSYRSFISETLNQRTKSNNDIYSNENKVKYIYNYCKNNNIIMSDSFLCIYNGFQQH